MEQNTSYGPTVPLIPHVTLSGTIKKRKRNSLLILILRLFLFSKVLEGFQCWMRYVWVHLWSLLQFECVLFVHLFSCLPQYRRKKTKKTESRSKGASRLSWCKYHQPNLWNQCNAVHWKCCTSYGCFLRTMMKYDNSHILFL